MKLPHSFTTLACVASSPTTKVRSATASNTGRQRSMRPQLRRRPPSASARRPRPAGRRRGRRRSAGAAPGARRPACATAARRWCCRRRGRRLRQRLVDPVVAEHHLVHRLVVGQHADGDLGAVRGLGRGAGDARAVGRQRLGPGARAVLRDDVVPGRRQVARHRQPHVPGPQECDLHPCSVVRRGEPRRAAGPRGAPSPRPRALALPACGERLWDSKRGANFHRSPDLVGRVEIVQSAPCIPPAHPFRRDDTTRAGRHRCRPAR